MTRLLVVPLATVLAGALLTACGDTRKDAQDPRASATASGGYLNDSDGDSMPDSGTDENVGIDADSKPSEDVTRPLNNTVYHDDDDRSVLAFGHEAGASERRAIAAAVERYHGIELAADGVKGCATIVASLAAAIPEDYGEGRGGEDLRSAKTCPAIVSLLFSQAHKRLSAPVTVTGIRVQGDQARVLLGSKTAPASYLNLVYEHGAWKPESILALVFP